MTVSPIIAAPKYVNEDVIAHPICQMLSEFYDGWEIAIASLSLPIQGLMQQALLLQKQKLDTRFFKANARVAELIVRGKLDDGLVLAYLQGLLRLNGHK